MILFFWSNLAMGGKVNLRLDTDSESFSPNDSLYQFTIGDIIHDMWHAGVYPLAILIAIFSGAWPYIKLSGMMLTLYLPSKYLSIEIREKILVRLDYFGKWSLIYIFVLVILMSAMNIQIPISNNIQILTFIEPAIAVTLAIALPSFQFKYYDLIGWFLQPNDKVKHSIWTLASETDISHKTSPTSTSISGHSKHNNSQSSSSTDARNAFCMDFETIFSKDILSVVLHIKPYTDNKNGDKNSNNNNNNICRSLTDIIDDNPHVFESYSGCFDMKATFTSYAWALFMAAIIYMTIIPFVLHLSKLVIIDRARTTSDEQYHHHLSYTNNNNNNNNTTTTSSTTNRTSPQMEQFTYSNPMLNRNHTPAPTTSISETLLDSVCSGAAEDQPLLSVFPLTRDQNSSFSLSSRQQLTEEQIQVVNLGILFGIIDMQDE
eukprot:gene8597-17730_t